MPSISFIRSMRRKDDGLQKITLCDWCMAGLVFPKGFSKKSAERRFLVRLQKQCRRRESYCSIAANPSGRCKCPMRPVSFQYGVWPDPIYAAETRVLPDPWPRTHPMKIRETYEGDLRFCNNFAQD